MSKQSSKINYVWLSLGAMLLIVLARLGFGINIPVFSLLAISIVPVLLGSPSQMLAMALTFIPLATAFQYKYAILLFLIIGGIRYRRELSFSRIIPIIIAMMIWELAHVDGSFSFSMYLRNFTELLFLGFIASIKWKDINYKLIARSLAIATIGVSLIIIYIQIKGGLESFMEMLFQGAEEYRFGQDTTEDGVSFGLNFNANQLGFICNMAIAGLLTLVARQEHSIGDVVMIGVLLFFGAMTLSRTFVAVALFLFVAFIFLSSGTSKQRSRNLLLLLVIAPILIWCVFEFAPSIIENFVARNDTDDITNGRGDLMVFYNDHIFSSPKYCFWGIGLQGYGLKIADIYGHHMLVCHNSIQEIWVVWGFLGVVLFALLICFMVTTSRRYAEKRKLFALVPLLALLFSSMAARIISSGTYTLALSLVYIIMCLNWNSKSNNYAKR